ncbi:MAG: hypothetical protein JNM10_05240 [Planctomycetia bacterium]|nr:hypothetical protein [Planctomycetia bacterium]
MTVAAPPRPAVVAVHMGYGHLRAGLALAEAAGADLLSMDRPPFASPHDVTVWDRLRTTYERLSRRTGLPVVGPAYRRVLEVVTAIPRLRPADTQREPSLSVRYMASLLAKGFGGPLVAHLKASGAPLVSTFYAAAIVAEAAGVRRVVSVITDADVNRVWAPADAAAGATVYAVPTARAARRLRAFGVPAARIHRTGFPLPREVAGADGADARRRALAARLARLDPRGAFALTAPDARALRAEADARDVARPMEVAFAVGGAGAQVELARRLVVALAPRLRAGTARLTLVAGTREDTAARLHAAVARAGLASAEGAAVEVLFEPTFEGYAARFHRRLADLDVLWTKPSEITFFGPAGFALALTTPLGAQEHANRAWARRLGAALDAGDPRHAGAWLDRHLADGALARVAFAAATRMPRHGTERILALAAGA